MHFSAEWDICTHALMPDLKGVVTLWRDELRSWPLHSHIFVISDAEGDYFLRIKDS